MPSKKSSKSSDSLKCERGKRGKKGSRGKKGCVGSRGQYGVDYKAGSVPMTLSITTTETPYFYTGTTTIPFLPPFCTTPVVTVNLASPAGSPILTSPDAYISTVTPSSFTVNVFSLTLSNELVVLNWMAILPEHQVKIL